jgi:hypothetical protein
VPLGEFSFFSIAREKYGLKIGVDSDYDTYSICNSFLCATIFNIFVYLVAEVQQLPRILIAL